MINSQRFAHVQAEWLALTPTPASMYDRFETVKGEADALIDSGRWTSGPQDMLRVIRRHRDELIHSRLIAWLFGPMNRHALGRAFLVGIADHLWPGEGLFRSGPIVVETEVTASGLDDTGRIREARADIVVRGGTVTLIIENKVDAGEQPAQCERLYWAWAGEGDTKWVFLSPSGRSPITAPVDPAKSAWRTMGYRDLREVFRAVIDQAPTTDATGRRTAAQYLATLVEVM